jgi:hypothetical protein
MSLVFAALSSPAVGLACSSCGCSLNSDWSTQGHTTEPGLRMDFRFDYFNQNQLRTGTGTVDRGTITFPTDREIQQTTVNRNYNLMLDYTVNKDWGVNVLNSVFRPVPYHHRRWRHRYIGIEDFKPRGRARVGPVSGIFTEP